ncbi:uncharacterized protein [Musca autumnalis]|uniref:uncharacterized protein n=1 Tax=Musca autumnalis TaxID=221902 RepID=UPI003CE7372D
MLAEIPMHNELQLNLTGNHFRLLNITALLSFGHVELAGNWWSCKWLVQEMMRMPKSINFGQTYAVHTEWSLALLETNGIDCYDEDKKRSVIILDTSKLWEQRMESVTRAHSTPHETQPSPPPLFWPKIRMDKFDSRSVVIWMLIAIALAFSALRIARKLVDRKERLKKLKQMEEKLHRNQAKLPAVDEAETDSLSDTDDRVVPRMNNRA